MKQTQSMTLMLVERSEKDRTPSTRIITDGIVLTSSKLDVSVGMFEQNESEYYTREIINKYTPCNKFGILDVSGKCLNGGYDFHRVSISNFTFLIVTNSVEFKYHKLGKMPDKAKEYVNEVLKTEVTK